jgi:hypothetical protein
MRVNFRIQRYLERFRAFGFLPGRIARSSFSHVSKLTSNPTRPLLYGRVPE